MNTDFSIKNTEIHIWCVYLPDFISQSKSFITMLKPDEIERAKRFKFAKHQQRFIVARYFLRKILNFYIDTPAELIDFFYNEHGKPYLENNTQQIFFNLSHSHDMALYGLVRSHEIGIDIEKIEPDFKDGIAKRFFNAAEYQYLLSLPDAMQYTAFYTIWARKEAIIKALGLGLLTPLESFSSLSTQVMFDSTNNLYIKELAIDPNYAAAIATTQQPSEIVYWKWLTDGSVAQF